MVGSDQEQDKRHEREAFPQQQSLFGVKKKISNDKT